MTEGNVRILVSIAAVFASLLLALTAILQWRTARQKLALDLFDRRIEYYRRVRAFIIAIANRSEDGHPVLMSFARDTDEARFYFGHDFRCWLDRLYFHALKALTLNEQLYPRQGTPGIPRGSGREDISTRYAAEVKWLTDQLRELEITFAPYLSLGAATVPNWPGFKTLQRRKVTESWNQAKAEVGDQG